MTLEIALYHARRGSCKVRVRNSTDSEGDEIFLMNEPNKVLVIFEMILKEIYDFSPDAVLLCLSSEKYELAEYVREFDGFLEYMKEYKAVNHRLI